MRQAQRRAMRRALRQSNEQEATELDGALVCGGCGRLQWPDSGGGAPHRRDAGGPGDRSGAPCLHCGERSFIDLGRPSTALALSAAEDDDAQARGSVRGRVLGGLVMGLSIGVMLGLLGSSSTWGLALVSGLGGLLGVLMALRGHVTVHLSAPTLPSRWAMALPAVGALEHERRGIASAKGNGLRAPLTGRPCIAWEVGVRRDDRVDAPLPSWWLLEQRVASISVDGHEPPPERTHLELPRQHLGALGQVPLDDAAQAFLRQRGIVGDAVGVELFESIVVADAPVHLRTGAEGSVLRPVGALATT